MNVGIIGVGDWGKNHVRVFCHLLGPESVRVADLDAGNLRSIRKKYDVKTTHNYRDLLHSSEIDAVSICTPSATHHAICKESMLLGKDVLCEKPLALDSSSCRELVALSEKEGRVLMVGHVFRFHSVTRKLKETIEANVLGRILYMQSDRLGLRTPRSDCGVIFDFAVHDVDILCYLLGGECPKEVTAVARSYLPHSVEDLGILTLEFSNNTLAHIVVSWLAPRKIRHLTIVGREKSVFADFAESKMEIFDAGIIQRYDSQNHLQLIPRQGPVKECYISGDEPLEIEIMHFLDCVNGRSRPIADGNVAVRTVEILEAAHQSVKMHKAVRIKDEF